MIRHPARTEEGHAARRPGGSRPFHGGLLVVVLPCIALLPVVLFAQVSRSSSANPAGDSLAVHGLPRDVAREVTTLFNATTTVRTIGPLDIEHGREVRGDIAVLNGPLTVAGHVTGRVLAINSDVLLSAGARIDGDLLVVGGDVEGRSASTVGGEIRIYRQALTYTQRGDDIVAVNDSGPDENSWWRRWERRRSRNWSKLQIASAGAYNRVEGLPINLGPQVQRITPWGSVRLDAYGVIRTAGTFSSTSRSESDEVGHNLRTEVAVGRDEGVAIGGRLFNTIDPVEDWQLTPLEAGLSAFVLHRDYQDYFERHGGNGYVTLFGRPGMSVTGSFGEERWSTRGDHNPFTLFSNQAAWRPNPSVDEGLVHIGSAAVKLDTRNDQQEPRSGWFMNADLERGLGMLAPPPIPGVVYPSGQPLASHVDYSRAFVDLRRYNRVWRDQQLNFRLVVGGWVGGDALPIERRLSLDGPGAMPGFAFRDQSGGVQDVGTCNGPLALPGTPANCERIVLGQMEYRGDLHFGFGNDAGAGDIPGWVRVVRAHSDAAWVLFVDAGRGWNVHANQSGGATTQVYATDDLPPLDTFRTDAGGGLDFGFIGFYAAKALSDFGEPARVFVRLRHRF